VSGLISARDGDERLSTQELLSTIFQLIVAGHDTTASLIGNGVVALLQHPEQLELVRSDPDVLADAVEELLRYDAPVQMTRRIPLAPLEIGGRTIPAGSFVLAALASANRDEGHFGPTAGTLDVGRADAGEHLAFGGGAHYCLGAALAKMEAQAAIGSLVQRFPALEQAGEPVYNGRINLRGLDRLELALG
jgi:cytochrome P450